MHQTIPYRYILPLYGCKTPQKDIFQYSTLSSRIDTSPFYRGLPCSWAFLRLFVKKIWLPPLMRVPCRSHVILGESGRAQITFSLAQRVPLCLLGLKASESCQLYDNKAMNSAVSSLHRRGTHLIYNMTKLFIEFIMSLWDQGRHMGSQIGKMQWAKKQAGQRT
jgi:hypothetical protein